MMNCSILHIDDNPQDLELTELALREAGHEGLYSGQTDSVDGFEALSRHAIPLPELIVLDLNMPKMTGLQFLEAAQADPRLRECRIVVLTTTTDPRHERDCKRLGAVAVLTKPIRYDDMVGVARRIISYC